MKSRLILTGIIRERVRSREEEQSKEETNEC